MTQQVRQRIKRYSKKVYLLFCNLIPGLKAEAFYTTATTSVGGAVRLQAGLHRLLDAPALPAEPWRVSEGVLAPRKSIPSVLYPMRGRHGCCLRQRAIPPGPKRPCFSHESGDLSKFLCGSAAQGIAARWRQRPYIPALNGGVLRAIR